MPHRRRRPAADQHAPAVPARWRGRRDPVEYDGGAGVRRQDRGRAPRRLASGRAPLTTATVSFAAELPGPEHGHGPTCPAIPTCCPAPDLRARAVVPLDELDIRIADDTSAGEFVRRLWWRATVALPDDPAVHTLVAAYVTDVYMIDPALQVHGHSMKAPNPPQRDHRLVDLVSSGRSGRRMESAGVPITGRGTRSRRRDRQPGRADGAIAATMTQEGLIAER